MFSTLMQVLPTTLPAISSDTRFAAGWRTLSLVNAGLAQGKSRSGLLWFIFSLLLGPLATFLIVVLPPVDDTPRPPARSSWKSSTPKAIPSNSISRSPATSTTTCFA